MLKNLFVLSFLYWCLIPISTRALETVTLQLKWKHQFQFAGYYAAREKGYYKDAGLDVIIREAKVGNDPVDQVIQGDANYGVGTTDLILSHHQGAPVVVLAVIFQHSPLALAIQETASTNYIQDIADKLIMIEPNSAELLTYLQREGLARDQLNIIEHSFDINDLLNKKVAAMSVYITDEPYSLKQENVDYILFKPLMGGIDFYGDNLFTNQDELTQNPERVEAFLQASLKGWKYALKHPEEIIQLIYQRYSKRHSIEHLRFEADKMKELIQPDLVEPGYMHIGRWFHIAQTYKQQNLLPDEYSLDGFLYSPSPPLNIENFKPWLTATMFFIFMLIILSIYIVRLNRKSRATQEWLTTIIENVPNALLIIDVNGNVIDWNQQAEKTFGWSAQQAIGKKAYELLVPADEIELAKKLLVKLFEKNQFYQIKSKNITKSGHTIMCQWNNAFISKDTQGNVYMVSMAIDITSQKLLEDKLKLKAHTDPLTGVTNRNLFYLKFNQSIKQARRDKKLLAVLFIDLDNFKNINDNHGHEAGDTVLKKIAERLSNNCREVDLVARIGGDEFVVLLYDCSDKKSTIRVAKKLLNALINPISISDSHLIAISASIGISLYPEHGNKPDSLLREADLAMYKVKQGSKNNIHIAELSGPQVKTET